MLTRDWHRTVDAPASGRHLVQFYRDDGFLRDAVGRWTARSLEAGGGAVLVATPRHAALVEAELAARGLRPHALQDEGRLQVVDAHDLLRSFMVGDQPDAARFRASVGGATAAVRRAAAADTEVRAWGEMVELLRSQGGQASARALEGRWNALIAEEGFGLLCSYRVDNLAEATHASMFWDLAGDHGELLPEEDEAAFALALAWGMRDVFGSGHAARLWARLVDEAPGGVAMPEAEAVLVGLHREAPRLGARVLRATRRRLRGLGGPVDEPVSVDEDADADAGIGDDDGWPGDRSPPPS